jgi:ketosteroid isomerase-like protein
MNTFSRLIVAFFLMQMSFSDALADDSENQSNSEAYQFFAHYLDAYNDFDAKAAAVNYHEKVSITGIGSTLRVNTNQDMQNMLGAFLQQLKEQGAVKFEWETLQVTMLGKNTALASNVAARYKQDGTVLNRAAATFIAFNTEAGWKILSLHLHSPEYLLKLTDRR